MEYSMYLYHKSFLKLYLWDWKKSIRRKSGCMNLNISKTCNDFDTRIMNFTTVWLRCQEPIPRDKCHKGSYQQSTANTREQRATCWKHAFENVEKKQSSNNKVRLQANFANNCLLGLLEWHGDTAGSSGAI